MAYRDYKKTKRIIKNFTENIEGKGEGDAKLQPSKNVTPTTEAQYVKADTGYDAIAQVNVAAVDASIDSNITAENIKKDVSILGVTGSYEAPTIPEYEGDYEVTENNTTLATTGKQLTDDITVNIEMPENPLDNTTVGRLYEVVENSGEKSLEDTDNNYIYYYDHVYDPETWEDIYTLHSEELVSGLAVLYFDSTVNKFELNEGSWYHYVEDSGTSFDEYTFDNETLYYYDYGYFDSVNLYSGYAYKYNGNGNFDQLSVGSLVCSDGSGDYIENIEEYSMYYMDSGCYPALVSNLSSGSIYEYEGENNFERISLDNYSIYYYSFDSSSNTFEKKDLNSGSGYIYQGYGDFESMSTGLYLIAGVSASPSKVDLPETGDSITITVGGKSYTITAN